MTIKQLFLCLLSAILLITGHNGNAMTLGQVIKQNAGIITKLTIGTGLLAFLGILWKNENVRNKIIKPFKPTFDQWGITKKTALEQSQKQIDGITNITTTDGAQIFVANNEQQLKDAKCKVTTISVKDNAIWLGSMSEFASPQALIDEYGLHKILDKAKKPNIAKDVEILKLKNDQLSDAERVLLQQKDYLIEVIDNNTMFWKKSSLSQEGFLMAFSSYQNKKLNNKELIVKNTLDKSFTIMTKKAKQFETLNNGTVYVSSYAFPLPIGFTREEFSDESNNPVYLVWKLNNNEDPDMTKLDIFNGYRAFSDQKCKEEFALETKKLETKKQKNEEFSTHIEDKISNIQKAIADKNNNLKPDENIKINTI